jgi:tRNA/tmRNA/rRNA uracil-C5-methylase (TrmA/RlmC/RlmD family)
VALGLGDKITLKITDVAFGGEGVGRLEDFVVFVPFVALDEEVEAEVVEVKKRFARARLLRVVHPSPQRVQAPCPYFTECGGCQYQHLDYATQLALKHKQVCDLFQRLGEIDPALVSAVVPCPEPYGYRNRIMIRSQWDKFKQGLNIGFIRADNRLVVDIEQCKIAEPALNEQIKYVRTHPPPKGGLKVVLRIPPEDWEVPPDSFFQNNFFLLPKLLETVRERLKEAGTCHLVDVFCGVGFFSIALADMVESFVGVEYDRMAIKAARRNAETRGITNGEFRAGAAEELLPELLERMHPETATVLLDPPRKGCQPETIQLLHQTGPAHIIYVSCHPATMARDLKLLCAAGRFKLARVVPLDMFPQTVHVECVADIRKGHQESTAAPADVTRASIEPAKA